MNERLAPYREILGVDPDATLEEINTAYYLHLEKFPENPTEEEEAFQQQLRHAYSVLKRTHTEPKQRRAIVGKRFLMPVLGVILVILGATLVVMNYSTIQMMVNRYEPADVLRWRSHQEPYGEVVRYEPESRPPHLLPTDKIRSLQVWCILVGEPANVWRNLRYSAPRGRHHGMMSRDAHRRHSREPR